MSLLRLSLACWDYDRTRALQDGRVAVPGIDLTFVTLRVEETFYRMLRHHEFDVSEMSLSSYVMTLGEANPPFVGVPVFPSKAFRHSAIYINRNAGIDGPSDLKGKTVGTPEYQMTAGVWQRGVLADEYGVPVDSVRYVTGGLEEPGRIEKLPLQRLPAGVSVQPAPADRCLSDMLESGEIDALYTADAPSSFKRRSPTIRRLFENYVEVEGDYVQRTGIFPIMHTLVVRRDVYEENRWVAQSLMKAFDEAKARVYPELVEGAALKYMLPWVTAETERTRAVLGADDFWQYGLGPNRKTLETFLRYSHEQGLAAKRYEPAELFAPECVDSWKK